MRFLSDEKGWFLVFLSVFLFLNKTTVLRAECFPAECDGPNLDLKCSDTEICKAKCCVSPAGGGGGTGSGSCFPAGTKISIPKSTPKNIENITPGEKVVSENSNGRQVVSTVQETFSPISDNICKIYFTNKDYLDVTKIHPLLSQGGWKAIDPASALLVRLPRMLPACRV